MVSWLMANYDQINRIRIDISVDYCDLAFSDIISYDVSRDIFTTPPYEAYSTADRMAHLLMHYFNGTVIRLVTTYSVSDGLTIQSREVVKQHNGPTVYHKSMNIHNTSH